MNDDDIDNFIYEDDDFEDSPDAHEEENNDQTQTKLSNKIDIDNDETIPDMRKKNASAKSRVSSNNVRPDDRVKSQNSIKNSERSPIGLAMLTNPDLKPIDEISQQTAEIP